MKRKALFCLFLFHRVTSTVSVKGKKKVAFNIKVQLLDRQTCQGKKTWSKHLFQDFICCHIIWQIKACETCFNLSLQCIYIWVRWKWEHTEECEKALESTVFYCESGYMPVFHEKESSCLLNSHFYIQLLGVLSALILHSIIHLRIVVV